MTRAPWFWPVLIVALLVGSAGANVALLLVATGDASFAVEKDYYRKALAWDATMAQERRNRALGWAVTATLEPAPAAPGRARLAARVTDRAGAPLTDAAVTVAALHSARAAQVFTVALTPAGAGRYVGTLPLARPGLWELRVRVQRSDAVFTDVLTGELAR